MWFCKYKELGGERKLLVDLDNEAGGSPCPIGWTGPAVHTDVVSDQPVKCGGKLFHVL
jgi:hypothetical protein